MENQIQTQIKDIIAKMPVKYQEEALRYIKELWEKTEKQSVERKNRYAKLLKERLNESELPNKTILENNHDIEQHIKDLIQ